MLSLGTLLAAAFAAGLFGVFFQTAYSPYVRAILPADQLVAANGWLQSSQSAAQISGPPLGGLLVQAVGAATAVIADAASFLVSLVALALIRGDTSDADAQSERAGMWQEVRTGLAHLFGDPLLRALAVIAALANLLLTSIGAVEVVFLVRTVGVSAGTVGIMFAAGGVGGLAGAVSASRIDRRAGTRTVARFAIAGTAPFALLLPLAHRGPTLAVFGVGAFAATFGIVLASVTFASIRQICCPPALLGRVLAGSRLLMAITIPLGALLGGAIGQHLGPRSAILGSAIGHAVVGVIAAAGPLRRPETAGTEAEPPPMQARQEAQARQYRNAGKPGSLP